MSASQAWSDGGARPEAPWRPQISIVVPAYNVAGTIEATLASVTEQTHPFWELIVVDDGSSDATAQKVVSWAQRDQRIHLEVVDHRGLSAARNRGISHSSSDWVMFLDADDTLDPLHLQIMAEATLAGSNADILYCGWRLIRKNGVVETVRPPLDLSDGFDVTARQCPFVIHAAPVRRTALVSAGGFDPNLYVAEDWDLWQRLARSGSRFEPVVGLSASYRLRDDSLSADLARLWRFGLAVIERGHSFDCRVTSPDPRYTSGPARPDRASAEANFSTWIASAAIRRQESFASYLVHLSAGAALDLDPRSLAGTIADGLARGDSAPTWPQLWPAVSTRILSLLNALEGRVIIPRFARRTLRHLELLMSADIPSDVTETLGGLHIRPVDISQPRGDIRLTPEVERVLLRVRAGDNTIGQICLMVEGHLQGDPVDTILRQDFGALSPPSAAEGIPSPSGAAPPLETLAFSSHVRTFIKHILRPLSKREPKLPGILESGNDSYGSKNYWERIFFKEDPWNYSNDYECLKYQQTLDALPNQKVPRALELACAEGHFTFDLAARVDRLIATDISPTALRRASERCAQVKNVRFQLLDIMKDQLPGGFDLIVCSEVLYYANDRECLSQIAERILASLNDGGRLVMAHANLLVDEPMSTGFRWPHAFGAKVIGESFADTPGFQLISERRSALYRIQSFQKRGVGEPICEPELLDIPHASRLPDHAIANIAWGSGSARCLVASAEVMPILTYHRIADDGPDSLRTYRVLPRDFESQLAWLRDNGFSAVTLAMLRQAAWEGGRLPDRPIMITFDDGYRDVLLNALPALQRYGFSGTVFVVTDAVGTVATWDEPHGQPARLLDWHEMRIMREAGISFAAHGAAHAPYTGFTLGELIADATRAAETLRRELGDPCDALAYAYGAYDESVSRILFDNNYRLGFTCDERHWRRADKVLQIPRIAVPGEQGLEAFAQRLRSTP
jgi:peptidoglycan/xylan/chitin deacetylase (PgdA/CDA1 family)/2-polyprenyl-3-methyl-5-hydroxy-6-metoxy-1,4-benzoquinol methylase